MARNRRLTLRVSPAVAVLAVAVTLFVDYVILALIVSLTW